MLPELRSAIIAECRRKVVAAEDGTLAIEFLIVEMADEIEEKRIAEPHHRENEDAAHL